MKAEPIISTLLHCQLPLNLQPALSLDTLGRRIDLPEEDLLNWWCGFIATARQEHLLQTIHVYLSLLGLYIHDLYIIGFATLKQVIETYTLVSKQNNRSNRNIIDGFCRIG